ncbi:MAG: UDP-2,3-diacylglucosamine diphosphatase LpxI [Candidatus Babeliales bacterium]
MIAVIAGTGSLPKQACKSLIEKNKNFFVISLFPQDNFEQIKEVVQNYTKIYAQEFFKLGKIQDLLKSNKATHVLFIGKVDKSNLLKNLKFDWLCLKLLASLASRSDKTIMEGLINYLKKENIEVLKQSDIMQSLFVKPGILIGKITKELQENIDFGMQVASNISFCDIGQTILVKDKMIIAVEAIEGTDKCIQRGIELGKNDLIICKTAHKNQNKKYDLPTLGPKTLENIKPGQVKVIAWHADQAFIADQEIFVEKAKELGIVLVAL